MFQFIFQKEVELLNSTFWEEQQITKKLNTIWLTWSTNYSTISISFHHFGCVNIATTGAAFWSINVLEILNWWTQHSREVGISKMKRQEQISRCWKCWLYQSITSRILGFPSEVVCNPAAAGSTPESVMFTSHISTTHLGESKPIKCIELLAKSNPS